MLFIVPLLRLLWVARLLVASVFYLRLALMFFVPTSICPSILCGVCAVCVRTFPVVIRLAFAASTFVLLWCAFLARVLPPPLLFPMMASPSRGGRRRRYNRTMRFIY